MVFASVEFLFLFLPICLFGFELARRRFGSKAVVWWLLVSSLAFYAVNEPFDLAVIGSSMAMNWVAGRWIHLSRGEPGISKRVLVAAVAMNLAVLFGFKYAHWLWSGWMYVIGSVDSWQYGAGEGAWHLPLGVSFFTFTQIAYLVDVYRGHRAELDASRYGLFVTFFPHLVAGPVIHHKEMMPQFGLTRSEDELTAMRCEGVFLVAIGLFKKLVVADWVASWVEHGFANIGSLTTWDAWAVCLGYAVQLYFDFSAYSEMAMGLALIFGVRFPLNFDSPYKSRNIAEFWRRWHMTLSAFLRDYIYIPLGGNRGGAMRAGWAVLATFLLGGLWHGAGLGFVLWGLMHATAVIACRAYGLACQRTGAREMPRVVAVLLTMAFVVMAWVPFRCESMNEGWLLWSKLLGGDWQGVPSSLAWLGVHEWAAGVGYYEGPFGSGFELFWSIGLLVFCVKGKNVHEIWTQWKEAPRRSHAWVLGAAVMVSVLCLNRTAEFLYFNF